MKRPSKRFPRRATGGIYGLRHFGAFALLAGLFLSVAEAQQFSFPTPPEAIRQEGVPVGSLKRGTFAESKIYPGTSRKYAVYLPSQYEKSSEPVALMIFQDGLGFCRDGAGCRAHVVFDHLIHRGEMPVTIGIFIDPGVLPPLKKGGAIRQNRSIEYDVPNGNYARFLIDEMIPHVESTYGVKISTDPNRRGLCGASSGGIAAFTAAWERPDSFRRVYTMVGTFTGHRGGIHYPTLVRRTEPKPLRVFVQGTTDDLNHGTGDWWIANLSLQRALAFAGYETDHRWGEGGHNQNHGASIFPEVMRWLWKTETVSSHPENFGSQARDFVDLNAEWEVVSDGHQWAEGLLSTDDGSLFFTDVHASQLFKVSPDGTKKLIDGDTGKTNGIALGPDGRIYGAAAGAREIRAWDPTTGKRETISEGTHSNDLVVHHQGHIYYTDPQAGKVWHLAPGNRQRREADPKFQNPNGIALSPDHSLLYVTDFSGRHIFSYQIRRDGSLAHKLPYFYAQLPSDGGHAHLDGMTVSSTGNLFVASSLGIQVFDERGRILIVYPRPNHSDDRTNYLAFGGPDRKTLYVATRQTIYKRPMKTLQGAHPLGPARQTPSHTD